MTEAMPTGQRILLATIAAQGILGHNSAVEMPKKLTFEVICRALTYAKGNEDKLRLFLDDLTARGFLFKYNTGHNGYGGAWIEGVDTWRITEAGLIELWS